MKNTKSKTAMQLNRHVVLLKKNEKEKEFELIEGDYSYLFSLIWGLTQDAWTFHRGENAERRLQRNVTNLVRRKR